MIKRAYVRGLAARGIYRARLRQKQAAGGLKDYAISGGIGAAGGGALGSLIGALVQYARGKNVLRGAGIGGATGAGAGLLGGLGYQFSKAEPIDRDKPIIVNTENGPVSLTDLAGNPVSLNTFGNQQAAKKRAKQWDLFSSKLQTFGNQVWDAMDKANKQMAEQARLDENSRQARENSKRVLRNNKTRKQEQEERDKAEAIRNANGGSYR